MDNSYDYVTFQKTTNLLKYRCYAYLDSNTEQWERVRVMKYDTKTQRAEVYLYEHNEFRIVPKSSFMELSPEFAVSLHILKHAKQMYTN